MNTEYRTSDIVLAACLKLNSVRLDRIEINGKRGIFVFNGVTEDFLRSFDSGRELVEPAAFNNEVRTLTTAIKRLTQNG